MIPSEIKAIFDLRLSPNTNPKEFEQMLVKWIEEAEGNDGDSGKISFEFQSVINLYPTSSTISFKRL